MRCTGKRRQFLKGSFGIFKCLNKAQIIIKTQVGFSEKYYCCNDDECFESIAKGYPVGVVEIK